MRAPDGRGYEPGPRNRRSRGLDRLVARHTRSRASKPRQAGRSVRGYGAALDPQRGGGGLPRPSRSAPFPIRANYLDIGSRRPLGIGAGSLALLVRCHRIPRSTPFWAAGRSLAAYPLLPAPTIRDEIQAARERGYVLILDRVIARMGGIGRARCWTRPAALLRLSALRPFPSGSASGRPYSGRALRREAELIKKSGRISRAATKLVAPEARIVSWITGEASLVSGAWSHLQRSTS